jgi:hypothetical protein
MLKHYNENLFLKTMMRGYKSCHFPLPTPCLAPGNVFGGAMFKLNDANNR